MSPLPCSFLLVATLIAQSSSPTWTTLPLDTYPTESRAQIQAAHDAALKTPAVADAVGRLAMVLHAWEQFDAAAAAYADARRLAPRNDRWWALSGMLASRVGRHDEAATFFEQARALAPSPLLSLRYADALLESGNAAAASDAFRALTALPQAEPAARYGLGRAALAAGDSTAARQQFERAVALVPTFGAAHYALAQLQRKAGDREGARASIAKQQACLACWPMPADPYREALSGVRSDAATLLSQGIAAASSDRRAAIALHEQALAHDPRNVQGRINLITLYAQDGVIGKAEAQYDALVTQAGAGRVDADAHRAWGLALLEARQLAKAEPILLRAVEASPQDGRSHNGLGVIREASGRHAEAEASYRQAVAALPQDREIRFNLARVLVMQRRYDEALAELTRLTEPADGQSAKYLYAAATVHVRKGDLAQGRAVTAQALERARQHGLTDLAMAIEKDLAKLK